MGDDARTILTALVSCVDLTSLEVTDTDEKIAGLCERALRPDPDDRSVPSVAAVCVFPRFAALVRGCLTGSGVRTAVAAGAFPEGTAPLEERLEEINAALEAGAEEIDTVLDHRALLAGGERGVREALRATREACDGATLKVILETGAIPSPTEIYRAAIVALEAGADFVKSSTGKAAPGATPEAARMMMDAARDYSRRAGRRAGVKLSGGIRTTEQALEYAALLAEVLGEVPHPSIFRIGASALLDDLILSIREPA